jgi:hypothetical protein
VQEKELAGERSRPVRLYYKTTAGLPVSVILSRTLTRRRAATEKA